MAKEDFNNMNPNYQSKKYIKIFFKKIFWGVDRTSFGLCIFLLCLTPISAQEITVEAIGFRKNQMEAEKNAIFSAVNNAIGAIVNSKILKKNENEVNRKIISYSDGYVKSWKIIGRPQVIQGGNIQVRIKAEVLRNKLANNLSLIDKKNP
ncbi:hypothetical protein ACFL35_10590 [Candidatus Riflebacteria bacterium]